MCCKSTHHNFFSVALLSFRPCGSAIIRQGILWAAEGDRFREGCIYDLEERIRRNDASNPHLRHGSNSRSIVPKNRQMLIDVGRLLRKGAGLDSITLHTQTHAHVISRSQSHLQSSFVQIVESMLLSCLSRNREAFSQILRQPFLDASDELARGQVSCVD